MRRPRRALLVALLALAGCGGPVTSVTSDAGVLQLTVQSDPAQPILGRNTFVVEVTSATGGALDGIPVTLTPWMPAHGHGSTEAPTITALGNGRYRAFPVTFFMAGEWQVTARATQGSESGVWMTSYSVP